MGRIVAAIAILLSLARFGSAAPDPQRIVVVEARRGNILQIGTGYIVDPVHVLTAAHVVRGGTSIIVRHSHCSVNASTCHSDGSTDVAYLHVPPHSVRAVRFVRPRPGQLADIAVLYRVGQPDVPARYSGRRIVRTCKQLFWVVGRVRQGDSGAAVVLPGGSVAGVVWGVSGGLSAAAPAGPPT